jgi:hypothetical protein
MSKVPKPDMKCVPYRRKALYFIITIPLMALYIAVFIYLWSFSFVWSLVFLSFYLLMCFFQAYCCAYQDCPYVGGFCPAITGILPASLLAKLLYGKKKIVKSKKLFDLNAMVATVGLLGLVFFPLYWLAKMGIIYAVGYIVLNIVYYLVFLLTICPVCAIRETCPGGQLQKLVFKKK